MLATENKISQAVIAGVIIPLLTIPYISIIKIH
jgi:hypothetical protein